MNEGREAISINEAAAAAGIGRTMLYQLIKEGAGPRTLRIGRRRLVRVEELRRWLLERESVA